MKPTLVPTFVSFCHHVEDHKVPGYIFGFLVSFLTWNDTIFNNITMIILKRVFLNEVSSNI
jgi:hypothetical protein